MAADNFNRANESPLGSPWVAAYGTTLPNLSSNEVIANTGNDVLMYYSGAATSADQYAQATTPAGNDDNGPAVRISAANDNAYFLDSADLTQYFKIIAGTVSTIGATGLTAPAAGDTIRIEVEGSTLRCFKNGVAGNNLTDTSIAIAGDGVGFLIYLNRLDNWEGGDLSLARPLLYTRQRMKVSV